MFIVIEGDDLPMIVEHGAKLLNLMLQSDRLDASFLLPSDYFTHRFRSTTHEQSAKLWLEIDFNEYEKRVREQHQAGVKNMICIQYYQLQPGHFRTRVDGNQHPPDFIFYLMHSSDPHLAHFVDFATRQHMDHCVVIDVNKSEPAREMYARMKTALQQNKRPLTLTNSQF